MKLKITNIQTFSIHDGPGIRTTVFLTGCPLGCVWCHNPEAMKSKAVLLFEEKKCTNCRACTVCPENAHTFDLGHSIDRNRCIRCGKCVAVCPNSAVSLSTRELPFEEYLKIVERQARVIGDNGGITFSGGEPMLQGKALIEFLEATPIHKAVETCGYAEEALFCQVVKHADYIMFDLKLADEALHRQYTGVSNGRILRNLENLRRSGKPYLLRTPLIPGITDTEENLSAIGRIVGADPWEKLPYNTLTPVKYERIGKPYPLENIRKPCP